MGSWVDAASNMKFYTMYVFTYTSEENYSTNLIHMINKLPLESTELCYT